MRRRVMRARRKTVRRKLCSYKIYSKEIKTIPHTSMNVRDIQHETIALILLYYFVKTSTYPTSI